jgi:hypothetical protein
VNRQTDRVSVGCNELAGSPFVSVKMSGFGYFLEQSKIYTLTAFVALNLAGADTVLVTLAH